MQYLENLKVLNEMANDAYAAQKQGEVASFPQNVSIVTTFNCNYRCKMCFQRDFSGELDWRIIENIEPILPFVREFHPFGGEPLLYKRIGDFYDIGFKYGCRIKIISNGSLLTPEVSKRMVENQVYRLLISTDAGTAETYKFIRGASFAKLMDNLAELARQKRAQGSQYPLLELNFLAMACNIGELGALVEKAAELEAVAINVFYPKILFEELVEQSLYFKQDYSDACLLQAIERGRELGVRVVVPELFNQSQSLDAKDFRGRQACTRPWRNLNVDLEGNAQLCCFGSPNLGNVLREDFQSVWNSPLAQKIRRTVGTPEEFEFCRKCQVAPFSPRNLEYHMSPELYERAREGRVVD